MYFSELLNRFLEHCRGRNLTAATVTCYQYCSHRWLVPLLGHVVVSKLRPADFEGVYARMLEHGAAHSTMHKVKVTAQAALKYAMREDWCVKNPAQLSQLPLDAHEPERADIPSEEVVRQFLAQVEPELWAYGRTLAGTGMRPGEAAALVPEQVGEGVIVVDRSLELVKGGHRTKQTKTRRIRKLAVDPETLRAAQQLADLPTRRHDDWAKLFRRAKAPFQPRDLRPFHATQLLALGIPVKQVAERLGHANPMMTLKVYARALPTLDAQAADTISRVLGA